MKFAVEVNIMEKYKGSITREQFLFFETRTVARLLSDGMTPVEIQSEILDSNAFFWCEKLEKYLGWETSSG